MNEAMTTANRDKEGRIELDAVKDDLAALRKDVVNIAAGVGQKIVESGTAAYESAHDAVKSSVAATEAQVTKHPWTSVLIAFGAGVIVAKLMSK